MGNKLRFYMSDKLSDLERKRKQLQELK